MWNKVSSSEGHGIDMDTSTEADVEVDDSGYTPKFA